MSDRVRRSHKKILDHLKRGAGLTTADWGHPVVHFDGISLMRPHPRTLDEMVVLGLIHHVYRHVGDGTGADSWWHLGPGGSEMMRHCPACETSECPTCHACFHDNQK